MEQNIVDLLLIAGAIAWLSTAFVYKAGPGNILLKFRAFMFTKVNTTVLTCTFCAGFWIGIVILSFWFLGLQEVVAFFGILGIASALRGASSEF